MKTQSLKSIYTFALMCLLTVSMLAQKNIASPRDSISGKVGAANVKINYGSPSVKGRVIWGDLVPYDKVWRTGANEATTISFDKDVMIEGKKLPKGVYSLFTIPGKNEWVIIFNKEAKQWGAYKYDEKQDALRVKVKAGNNAELREQLKFELHQNSFVLLWEHLQLQINVN